MDWAAWHQHYDDPASPLNDRLRCVQAHLADAFDRTPQVRAWFARSGFEEIAFDAPERGPMIGVGVARLSRTPATPAAPASEPPGERLFTFRSSA